MLFKNLAILSAVGAMATVLAAPVLEGRADASPFNTAAYARLYKETEEKRDTSPFNTAAYAHLYKETEKEKRDTSPFHTAAYSRLYKETEEDN